MYNVIVSAPEYNSSLEFLGYYCSIVCGTCLCTLCAHVSVYCFRAFTYLSRGSVVVVPLFIVAPIVCGF